jgi:hypothetical protein
MPASKKAKVASYRAEAVEARLAAEVARTPKHRVDYLRLAADWDKLADNIENDTFLGPTTPSSRH